MLIVTTDEVQALSDTLPAGNEISFAAHLGLLQLADVLRVRQDTELSLTVGASLHLAVRGLRLTLLADPLLSLLAPGGLVLEGDVQAELDARGVRFQGGGKNGVSVPLRVAPPGLRAPTLYLAPASPGAGADGGLRLTASCGASLLGLAEATLDGIGSELAPGGAVTPVPPTGLGLSLAVGPPRGRGFLERRGDAYQGRWKSPSAWSTYRRSPSCGHRRRPFWWRSAPASPRPLNSATRRSRRSWIGS
ncbi:hypothetical protein OHB39_38955 [Streptomyces sp. NBC_00047]|uniref:hypothetical protein n=1 Tax=Streptomyces sp. NBC_00047 TaxID=2975627 RepID=UPI002256A3DA|nr:hypothetical protein [Streptomyces sp. NBC_00047]MCX5613440.1 hypothetical protein [Streptomyces sp. NBC_00047]